MKVSLASATSLLAFLLLDGREAVADPIIKVGTSVPFYYALGSTWDAGTDTASPVDSTETYRFTPLVTGVAATTESYSGSTPYFLVGPSPLAKLASSGRSDGNPSSLRGTMNLRGTDSAGNSVFVGTSGDFSLSDTQAAFSPAASASFGYTLPQAAKGATTAEEATTPADGNDQTKVDDLPAAAEITRSGHGDLAGNGTLDDPNGSVSPNPGSMTASGRTVSAASAKNTAPAIPGYTYNPLSRGTSTSAAAPGASNGTSRGTGVSQAVTGAAGGVEVGRAFSDSNPGASVFNTRNPVDKGSVGPAASRTSSSAIHNEAVKAFFTALQRGAGDVNPVDASLANLTVNGYRTVGADASSFNVTSRPDGSVVTQSATVPVPIKVVGTGSGELPSSLTIFAAGSKALDGAADSFTFFFDRGAAP
ncbi:MAG: hypothetical protein P4L90_18530 [Rhodopila sp.]|nr:hypothetical protein [Rhodopila sp.]